MKNYRAKSYNKLTAYIFEQFVYTILTIWKNVMMYFCVIDEKMNYSNNEQPVIVIDMNSIDIKNLFMMGLHWNANTVKVPLQQNKL